MPNGDPQLHRLHPLRWRAATALFVLAAGAAACDAGRGVWAAEPGPLLAGCRSTVTADGRAADAPLRWTRPAGDPARLDRWCAAVGPAVVRAPSGPAADPVADSVAVVSWNVHVGGGDVAALVDSLRAGRLTGGVPVRSFVLLLQEALRVDSAAVPARPGAGAGVPRRIVEAPEGRERVDVVRLADSLGLSLAYAPSMRNGREGREDRGNAILSTLPLSDLEAVELGFESQRRVAVTAVVEGRSAEGCPWRARVTTVHLDNWSGPRHLLRSLGNGRLRQGRGLMAALAAEDTTAVHLLAGDLNTVRGTAEEVVEMFRAGFPQSPRPLYQRTHASGLDLDHVFLRSPSRVPARSRRAGERFGSDHYPLVTWMRVAPPAACSRRGPRGPST